MLRKTVAEIVLSNTSSRTLSRPASLACPEALLAVLVAAVQLVALERSKLRGLVNTRVGVMQEIGWDPEWEVNPKELKLVERIGEWTGPWCRGTMGQGGCPLGKGRVPT